MDINQIKTKAQQLRSIITGYKVPTLSLDQNDAPKYDGTFRIILNLVMQDKLKLLIRYGQVVGISVDSGTGSIEQDNLAGENFARAYDALTAYTYVQTAMALKMAGAIVDDIVEDNGVRIYLYQEGKVLNEYGNTIAELTEEEKRNVTMDTVREALDAKLQPAESTPSRTHNDLPKELDVDEDAVIEAGGIGNYLRGTYKHYLAKGHDFSWDYDNGVYHVFDIEWGRKI